MARYDVFVSYRRDGGYDTAKHLYDLLSRDGYRVSFDIDTLREGDFDVSLLKRIDECKDFILIVDAHAFDRTVNPNFNPKHDWLRQELAYALAKGKNIIPVFLHGVSGFPANLPSDVCGVSKKNGPEYNRYYFNDFYRRLKKFLIAKPVFRWLKWLLIFFAIVALVGFGIVIARKHTPGTPVVSVTDAITAKSVDIQYLGRDPENTAVWFHSHLYAKVDGYEYEIDVPHDQCYQLESQQDFDGDGVDDLLVRNVQACGGNGLGDSFFFVKYDGNGFFSVSKDFGRNVWADIEIEDWNGTKSVVIYDSNTGFNNESEVVLKERYVLKQGDAVRVESSKQQGLSAIKEIKNTDFKGKDDSEVITMDYDLNGDGIDDEISCSFWPRWGAILTTVTINGVDYVSHSGVKRVGVLNSETNGYHDLVLGNNSVYKWDGKKYVCGDDSIAVPE